jgi:hypothetical protein
VLTVPLTITRTVPSSKTVPITSGSASGLCTTGSSPYGPDASSGAPTSGPYKITGRVVRFIPFRHRRGEETTHIGQAMTEFTLGDRVGYGLSEYLIAMRPGPPACLTDHWQCY